MKHKILLIIVLCAMLFSCKISFSYDGKSYAGSVEQVDKKSDKVDKDNKLDSQSKIKGGSK